MYVQMMCFPWRGRGCDRCVIEVDVCTWVDRAKAVCHTGLGATLAQLDAEGAHTTIMCVATEYPSLYRMLLLVAG